MSGDFRNRMAGDFADQEHLLDRDTAVVDEASRITTVDVQVIDVARLDDPRLMSMLDVPLIGWARQCLEMGLKPLPKKEGTKSPVLPWEPYQTRFPDPDELSELFARPNVDGICVVLDNTGYVVIDCNGPRDRSRRLLAKAGIEIPDLCPRVMTGRDRDHFYLRTTRPVGRYVGLLRAEGVSIHVFGEGVIVVPPSPHPETGIRYHWQPPILGSVGTPTPPRVPKLPARAYELIDESSRPTQLRLALVDGPIKEAERERTLASTLGAPGVSDAVIRRVE